MKTRIVSLFVVLLTAGVISCSPDDFTVSGIPKSPPVVAGFDVPGLLFAGVPTDVAARVNGTTTNPIGKVKFQVFKKGTSEMLREFEVTPSTTTGVVMVTWTAANSTLSTLATGDYMLVATASNGIGSTVSQTYFSVPDYVVPQACQVVGQVTVIMLTPQTIDPGVPIGAVGDFPGSGWGTDTFLTYIKNGVYCAAVPLEGPNAFKFRIDPVNSGGWGKEEKTETCGGAPNRTAPGGAWPSISIQNVPKWGGYGC